MVKAFLQFRPLVLLLQLSMVPLMQSPPLVVPLLSFFFDLPPSRIVDESIIDSGRLSMKSAIRFAFDAMQFFYE